MMTRHLLLALAVTTATGAAATAQLQMGPRLSPGGIPVLDNPTPPPVAATDVLAPAAVRSGTVEPTDILAGTAARSGQQHWVSLNLGSLQPTTARLGVKVWDRPNGSLWLEVYGGSVLVDAMYGFGARLQFTAKEFWSGDQLMIAPGIGTHILPQWEAETRGYRRGRYSNYSDYRRTTLYFLVGDVDISWLHDFSPHFGFELGVKLGLAARVGGDIGDWYPEYLMFGPSLYPVVSFHTGFRF